MSNEVAMQTYQSMPVMNVTQALARRSMLAEFISSILIAGTDYGLAFEGASKPTLLMPGAEKLSTFFGLTPKMILVEAVQDWTGEDHNGEPFFYFWYKCELWRGDQLIASSDGSCNSWESKYRYRDAQRKCPVCGQETIIKCREEYGSGWLCWAKKGGCGAKWPDGTSEIEKQEIGKILNPNPADLVNTIQKIAQKRAFVGTVKTGVNASDFFTQDMEDFIIESEVIIDTSLHERRTPVPRKEKQKQQPPSLSSWKQDSPTGKRPPVKGSKWTAAAIAMVENCSYYQNTQGDVDWFHLLGVAGKLGWLQINDENVKIVIDELEEYADQATAERDLGEQLAAEAIANQDMS